LRRKANSIVFGRVWISPQERPTSFLSAFSIAKCTAVPPMEIESMDSLS
jgi:hypothetical protein